MVGTLWRCMPGVPIFFFVSGFLISRSYESNSEARASTHRNRGLRIYPALIVCTALSLLSVAGDWVTSRRSSSPSATSSHGSLGQITIFQFYGPVFMRAFGTGVLNGSLWTISVELQFYVLIPLLSWVLRTIERSGSGPTSRWCG